jgi:hypothetical protein
VRSIAGGALNRKPVCIRSYVVRSIMRCEIDRMQLPQYSYGAVNEAMVARAAQDMWLTRHALDRTPCAQVQCARSHWQVRHVHLLQGLKGTTICLIPPL